MLEVITTSIFVASTGVLLVGLSLFIKTIKKL
mgnify:FL=1